MKVKIFICDDADKLECEINSFLSTLYESRVIDIKYSSSDHWCDAMIIYKD